MRSHTRADRVGCSFVIGRRLSAFAVASAIALSAAAMTSSAAVAAQPSAALDKGHRILMERGLQIQALVFWDCAFNLKQMQSAGFTSVNWGWKSRMEWLGPPPGILWSRWLKNEETDLPAEEQSYASNAVALSLADEQDLNQPQVREA